MKAENKIISIYNCRAKRKYNPYNFLIQAIERIYILSPIYLIIDVSEKHSYNFKVGDKLKIKIENPSASIESSVICVIEQINNYGDIEVYNGLKKYSIRDLNTTMRVRVLY